MTIDPTGPLVGLILVTTGGALGFTVGVAVGVGPADAAEVGVAVGIADAVASGDAVAVGVADGFDAGLAVGPAVRDGAEPVGVNTDDPPEQPTTLETAKNDTNRKRLRTKIADLPARAVASRDFGFLCTSARQDERQVKRAIQREAGGDD